MTTVDAAPATEDRVAHLPLRLRGPLLRRRDASEYLDLAHGIRFAPTTLAKLATLGGGPAFRKSGRVVLYPRAELDAWAEARLSGLLRSTSDVECGR